MKLMQSLHEGSAAMAVDFAPGRRVVVHRINLHLSEVGGAGNLVIQLDAGQGAAHDVVHLRVDMSTVKDLVWAAGYPIYMNHSADVLKFVWANANNRDWGLEIIYSQISGSVT